VLRILFSAAQNEEWIGLHNSVIVFPAFSSSKLSITVLHTLDPSRNMSGMAGNSTTSHRTGNSIEKSVQ
jgi:hypothetical protein